jgi:hypothetical protein
MVRLIRRLRGLQIDHHFKFARLLDWQFGRLCAFKNPCRLRPPWRDRARTATTRAVERIRRTCERAGNGRTRCQFRYSSTDTVEAMRARHPALETLEVPDQGHAPLLAEADTIARIGVFVGRCYSPGSTAKVAGGSPRCSLS